MDCVHLQREQGKEIQWDGREGGSRVHITVITEGICAEGMMWDMNKHWLSLLLERDYATTASANTRFQSSLPSTTLIDSIIRPITTFDSRIILLAPPPTSTN